MPHLTFVYPSVGRPANRGYIKSWQMQPLAIAALSGLTPGNWERSFFDDRIEDIDFERKTDLVAISIETFTAKRGYQIAAAYRRRGIAVIMGGYHATSCPAEALEYADAVCVGDAEPVWAKVLSDARANKLRGVYEGRTGAVFSARYDRSIFKGKNYFDLALVETGRGCRYNCTFCSITAFHQGACKVREVEDVLTEIRALDDKAVFFVDDNIAADHDRARALFSALRHEKIKWIGQVSLDVVGDPELLDLMAESGCAGLLVGFETLDRATLTSVGKDINSHVDYSRALSEIRARGIVVYGTFLLGLGRDGMQAVEDTLGFAIGEKLFIAAFNHAIPFPGTPFYRQLKDESRLRSERWWLDDGYRFGDVPFSPTAVSAVELAQCCHEARKRFFSVGSILTRALDPSANAKSLKNVGLFIGINLMLRKEVSQRHGLALGN